MASDNDFVRRINIAQSGIDLETVSLSYKVVAHITNLNNKAICDAVIDYARQAGVTDLFLLDEEFVKAALINEAKRRRGGTDD